MTDLALAVDLGGTKVEAALVTADGTLLGAGRSRRPTGRDLTSDALAAAIDAVVADAVAAVPAGATLVGAGIGSAGPVDLVHGVIRPVNMPGVHGFALAEAVGAAAVRAGAGPLPVALRHDGGCLALAESWVGATRGARASLAIVVSTGIGGGFVVDGRPLSGASGNAGHLGQTRVGDRTLEEQAAGPPSVAWARGEGWTGTTGEELAASAASGDPVARTAIERSARLVGGALADAATLLDLDVIAIGGGFSRVSDDYVDLVASALRAAAVLPYAQATRVVRSALGNDGPLLGAGALVLARA